MYLVCSPDSDAIGNFSMLVLLIPYLIDTVDKKAGSPHQTDEHFNHEPHLITPHRRLACYRPYAHTALPLTLGRYVNVSACLYLALRNAERRDVAHHLANGSTPTAPGRCPNLQHCSTASIVVAAEVPVGGAPSPSRTKGQSSTNRSLEVAICLQSLLLLEGLGANLRLGVQTSKPSEQQACNPCHTPTQEIGRLVQLIRGPASFSTRR